MNSEASNESESSLPTQRVQIYSSSPPNFQPAEVSFNETGNMNDNAHFKSEPPATQIDQPSKPPLRRVNSNETERPPSAQQVIRDADETDEDEDDEEEVDSDPAEKMADFDWNDLHQRYHDAMNACQDEEAELAQEWDSLMAVRLPFSVFLCSADGHCSTFASGLIQAMTVRRIGPSSGMVIC